MKIYEVYVYNVFYMIGIVTEGYEVNVQDYIDEYKKEFGIEIKKEDIRVELNTGAPIKI